MENLKQLFPLNENDIRTISNSRVNRADGNKQLYWMIGAMIVMSAGVFVYKVNVAIGWALLIAGAVGLLYYLNNLSKKQKGVVDNFIKQWREQAK